MTLKTLLGVGLISGLLLSAGTAQAVVAATGSGRGDAANNIAAATVGEGFIAEGDIDAEADSTATAELLPGYLTLDAVPDFQFESTSVADVIRGAVTLNLADAAQTASVPTYDGNANGELIVSDYRGNNAGWHLMARVGAFEREGSDAQADAGDIIYLSAFNFAAPFTGDNIGAATAGGQLLGGATVLDAPVALGTGTTRGQVASASVALMQNPAAKTGVYHATLNWTLQATPTAAAAE
ncbi:WxL domain-containing protein [Lacticaseibacillus daqingensis]|uniref:WxL domain-containing protein n=1 Tax=Lacticaseibacillus daqingensis TaxID=2486014 RepID=UPI000F78F63A|nr:WxL domain-containing protein [Lacticaseibacillus daqingensis]